MNLTLSEIAAITCGELIGEDATIEGVSTDTRKLEQGQLFVALVGEQFNPHTLIAQGNADNAAAVLVQQKVDTRLPQIIVNDTYLAIQELAKNWRSNFNIPIIGVTGSNGKTSVKEFIKQILSTQGNVLATTGNLNNHIGVPLTLFRLQETHQFAVIEMGANHIGEIKQLASIASPNIGVITNIGPAHLEGFGSIEGVAKAKSELYEGLQPDGVAIVNVDEPYATSWEECIGNRMKITFGLLADADVNGSIVDLDLVEVKTPLGDFKASLQTSGQHSLYNALAATAVGLSLGIDLEDIKNGLEITKPVPGRLILRKGIRGAKIIDDSYNANPASLHAALNVQSQEDGEHWLVLGDMGELGELSEALHIQAGEMAKQIGVTRLFGLGDNCKYAVNAFGPGARHFETHSSLIEALQDEITENVCLLIKGSRAMQLEKVVTSVQLARTDKNVCNEYAA